MKDTSLIYKYHKEMESDRWVKEIPYLSFPADWQVKIIPGFAGAVIRFCVSKGDKSVSVYLDCYGILGSVSKPYWEIYPYRDDVGRFYMEETEELLKAIEESLNDNYDTL